ncbi:MAG TPA: response regulator transcription factor [Vicinamibacterales bacterium]|nr:response regulator transcription factor [Vicinamibacterales bacterium]
MAKHRILIVEDERDIAGLIKHTLERNTDSEAEIVGSGDTALKAMTERPPDLLILDLNLPVLSGVEVCRIVKARSDLRQVPIIMLTARTSEDDRVSGLELGADDYITKPFSLRELTARVRAVLRRVADTADRPPAGVYRDAHLVADFDAVSVAVDGTSVRLTRREFELLHYLVQNKNRVISRDRLLERVWGYDRSIETRSVDVHVGRLRSKLRVSGRQIETVVGLGYRFVDEQAN